MEHRYEGTRGGLRLQTKGPKLSRFMIISLLAEETRAGGPRGPLQQEEDRVARHRNMEWTALGPAARSVCTKIDQRLTTIRLWQRRHTGRLVKEAANASRLYFVLYGVVIRLRPDSFRADGIHRTPPLSNIHVATRIAITCIVARYLFEVTISDSCNLDRCMTYDLISTLPLWTWEGGKPLAKNMICIIQWWPLESMLHVNL